MRGRRPLLLTPGNWQSLGWSPYKPLRFCLANFGINPACQCLPTCGKGPPEALVTLLVEEAWTWGQTGFRPQLCPF